LTLSPRRLAGGLALGALLAWPFILSSPFDLRMLTLAGAFAIMVIGYQFIFGHVGALALSQGAFFGLGAYATALASVNLGTGLQLTLPLSILVAVVVAAIVAVPVLRLSSHYFALATLGIGQVLYLISVEWVSVTGGANGFPGVPLPVFFGWQIGRGWPLLLLVWGLVGVGALLSARIMRGLYGHACHVMRQDEVAARSLGIDADRIRFTMLLLSAAFGGAAGALYAHTIRIASPEALEFKTMLTCITMAVVGGRTRIWGAILGALLVIHLPEWFRFFEGGYLIIFSAIIVVLLVLAPDGLSSIAERMLPPAPPSSTPAWPETPPAPIAAILLPSATPILELRDLSKRFGGLRALENVSFAMRRGTITAVIGPNGSGKTTMVNCITGIYRPDEGVVRLGGQDITGVPPHLLARRGVARTFQNLRLVDDMSVLNNVAVARFGAEGVNLPRTLGGGWSDHSMDRAHAHALHLLHRLGVGDAAGEMCGALPYGAKRRVEIARALALDPMLLLLDEPAAGLNETEQADLADRLQDLAAEGLTLLIIEHNLAFLRPLATSMICLDDGEVIAEGRPQDIYRHPRVLDAYLGTKAAAAEAAAAG
jgi:branched-chain amino acid transport system permease protein